MSAWNDNGAGENATVPRPEPFESADDYAFRLQLMEAMSASLSINQPKPSSSTKSSSSSNPVVSGSSIETQLEYAIQKAKQLKHDLNLSQGECSRSVNNKGVCRVYFKGLVENCGENGGRVAGIGVAICDKRDRVLLFTRSKPLKGEFMNKRLVAVTALIEGLTAALDLGITHVVFCCDYYPIYMMVIGRWSTKQDKLGVLLKYVQILRKEFTKCRPSYVARSEVKFAYKLAREAMVSQTNKHAGSSGTKIESCRICLEDVDACQIFSVDGCMHRYCFSCMKQHVEAKLLNAILPKCPHDGCTSVLELDSCQKFLTPKLIQIMSERLAEAAIPVTEKIYCPYPRCSALMSKNGILEYSKSIFPDAPNCGVRKCMKCHGLFCVNCQVPWHNNMTCYVFKNNNFSQHAEDVKLKNLAEQNLWRQCVKCNHMIELTKGCYHMTCRCGYEFCYTCGSEWKNKKATCTCPLWSTDYILDDDSDDDYIGEFEMEVGNDDEFFDDDDDDFDPDMDVENLRWRLTTMMTSLMMTSLIMTMTTLILIWMIPIAYRWFIKF